MTPDQLKSAFPEPGAAAAYNNRNIAIEVASIDVANPPAVTGRYRAGSVTGRDLETGESVTMRLRELRSPNPNAGCPAKWGDYRKTPRGIPLESASTEVGGVIVFENVYKRNPPDAQFGVAVSHYPGEASVQIVQASVYRELKSGKVGVDVVRTEDARVAPDAAALEAAILEALERVEGAMVRIVIGNEVLGAARVYRGNAAKDGEPYRLQDCAAVLADFKTKPHGAALFAAVGRTEGAVVEVVPVERLQFGVKTLEALRGKAAKMRREPGEHIARNFAIGAEEYGVTHAILSTRAHANGGKPLVSAEVITTMGRPTLVRMADVATPNLTPTPKLVVQGGPKAQAPAEQAPAAQAATPSAVNTGLLDAVEAGDVGAIDRALDAVVEAGAAARGARPF